MAASDLPDVDSLLDEVEAGATYAELAGKYKCAVGTVHARLNATPELTERSARAREKSAEAWLDRGLVVLESALKKGGEIDPTAARAYAQECARRAAIRNPQYREKQQHEHSGPGGKPIQFEKIECVVVDPKA